MQRRFVSAISGINMTFTNGQKNPSYGGSSTDDNLVCIPVQIIGYK